ncbi:MAG: hotdog fold thioesterase [Micrococcales bacterium]|nr:hotdog fold thioesterase [Micrococcales bacterium]
MATPTPGTTRSSAAGPLAQRLGIAVHELSAQRATGTMPVVGNTQPAGLLHGGASVVLAETLGSMAAAVHAGPGRTAVGIEISATHHRAVRDGSTGHPVDGSTGHPVDGHPTDEHVTGTATALHLGQTVASYEITVEDSAGRRVCTARLTCLVVAAGSSTPSS